MKGIPNRNELKEHFEAHAQRRLDIVRDLTERVEKVFASHTIHPTIKGRTKDFFSYFKKTLRLLKAHGSNGNGSGSSTGSSSDLLRITDLMGVRIVCPFIEDLSVAEDLIKENFDVVEIERKSHGTFKEFGYESTHLLINIPPDIIEARGSTDCDMAEVQIRTILQDAWAEVEHELVYKAEFNPFDTPMKRKLAAVNASLSLADIIFQEIRTYQRQLNGELGKRRETFFQKIEDENDSFLFSQREDAPPMLPLSSDSFDHPAGSIDDHLLLALSAHNRNRFDEAITLYSRILKLQPSDAIASIIYKHRGMANFAQSKYEDAIDDFTNAIQLDGSSYKALYYRGVVKSVMQDYSGAIEDYTLSLAIHPYQAFCLFRRGQAYYHLGDNPEALSDCDSSLAIEPDNEAARKFKELLQGELKM